MRAAKKLISLVVLTIGCYGFAGICVFSILRIVFGG